MVPKLRAVHYEPGDGPTECVALLTQSFRAQDFFGLLRVPGFVDWYRGCDFRPGYDYHRLCLQLLQSRAPGRWSLKAPGHLHALDALTAVYPDARLIVTHRDPLGVVPSAASLSATSRPDSLSRKRDRGAMQRYYGRLWLDELGLMTDRLLDVPRAAARGRVPRPPVPASWCAIRSAPCARRMRASARRSRRKRRPRCAPTSPPARRAATASIATALADFGLSEGEVRERFARYVERFGGDATTGGEG